MIHRLRPGDERRLQELCRRFKERVPSDDEATSLLRRKDIYVWVAEVEAELAGLPMPTFCPASTAIPASSSTNSRSTSGSVAEDLDAHWLTRHERWLSASVR
jgi:hypothetical protein